MSDANTSGFGQFVPGFEFLQNLARQATSGLVPGGAPTATPGLPQLGSWVAPTFNVEDLDKRIQELKAVHFWLEQNSRALSATIQALEVQRMTLATLQGMNVSMGDVANVLKVKAADTMASMAAGLTPKSTAAAPAAVSAMNPVAAPAASPAASAPSQFAGLEVPAPWHTTPTAPVQATAPAPSPAPAVQAMPAAPAAEPEVSSPTAAPAVAGAIDPMLWWGALTQQFQTIAANALNDTSARTAVDAGTQMASSLTREAVKTATEMTAGLTRGLAAQAGTPAPAAAGVAKKAPQTAARTAPKKTAPVKAKVAPKTTPKTATRPVAAAKVPAKTKAVGSGKTVAAKTAQPSSGKAKAPVARRSR